MRSNGMRLVAAKGPSGRVEWSEDTGLATLIVGDVQVRMCPTALRQLTRTLIDAACVMSQLEARCEVVRNAAPAPSKGLVH